MGELWHSVSETMWKRPAVWLPVLIADLLGFFVNFGRLALLRSVLFHRTEFHSALGGAPMRAPMTAAAVHSATTLALFVDWTSYFLRLLLYAAALIATAALVAGFRDRAKRPWAEVLPAVRDYVGGIFSLSLRALAIYGAGALVFSWIGTSILAHGHKAWLANGWYELGATFVVMVALALLLAPVAIQVLGKRYAPRTLKQRAQLFAFSLGLVALALGTFVGANMRTIRGGASVGRALIEISGSWIVALPYAVLFVALSFVARDIPLPEDSHQETATTT